jgi:hypothetical protein
MKLREEKMTLLLVFFSVLAIANYSEVSVLALSQKYKESVNTCADLQKVANRIAKNRGISFQGFEGLPAQTNIYPQKPKGTDRLCQFGYLTSVSPMGKKICRAHIYANTEEPDIRWDIGRHRSTFYAPENYESEYCRYIN